MTNGIINLLDRPDKAATRYVLIVFYGNKISLKHLKILPVLQNGVSNSAGIFQNIFEIFSMIVKKILNLTPAVATWYTDAFWSSVTFVFLLKLAPCEHSICRHSQKKCNVPPETFQSLAEYWTFHLTSHGQMFLIFFIQIHWPWRSFWKVFGN